MKDILKITVNLFFKFFFLLGVGFISRRKNILSKEDQKSMSTILLQIVVYFMIIVSSQDEFSTEVIAAIKVTGIAALLFYSISIPLLIFIARRTKLSHEKARIFVASTIFFNVTFLGYPLMNEIFGTIGLLSAIMFSMIYNILFNSWGIAYIEGNMKNFNLESMIGNKVALTSVLAMIMYILQIKIPEPLLGTFATISSMAFPLSMLIIGCNLGEIDIKKIITEKEIYPITLLRMVLTPLIVFVLLLLFGINKEVIRVITLIFALPNGFMTVIVATDCNCAPDYASKILIQSMIAMCITFPLWQLIINII